ncbi:MAG: hypothetical protein AAFZ65_15970 [Planctomycetota bacterium]
MSGAGTPPSGWETDIRKLLGAVRPEQVLERVLSFDFDLGGFGVWLDRWSRPDPDAQAPNSMNEHGRPLEGTPAQGLGAIVIEGLLEPLRRAHFADVLDAPLDADYAYVIEYGEAGDADLPLHVDASHLTLNVCLGDAFDGGDLVFEGLRCERHRELAPKAEELCALEHRPGRAYVHLGAHRHRVSYVGEGRRRNLIVWARNEAAQATLGGNGPCGPWCGASAGA